MQSPSLETVASILIVAASVVCLVYAVVEAVRTECRVRAVEREVAQELQELAASVTALEKAARTGDAEASGSGLNEPE